MGVKIFIEGGGVGGATMKTFRSKCQMFFDKMLVGRDKLKITPGGGRSQTLALFLASLKSLGKSDYSILLVDAEGPLAPDADKWDHILATITSNAKKPKDLETEDLHFMVQIMESWFLADPHELSSYYGSAFRAEKLPKPINGLDIETHLKDVVLKKLSAAVKPCQTDGYAKSDGWDLIALIDPAEVCKVSHFARELRKRLLTLLPERE